jgi:hypothetical protein
MRFCPVTVASIRIAVKDVELGRGGDVLGQSICQIHRYIDQGQEDCPQSVWFSHRDTSTAVRERYIDRTPWRFRECFSRRETHLVPDRYRQSLPAPTAHR